LKAGIIIEIFKTNIENHQAAKLILDKLLYQYPSLGINFDLDDCDRILRVEGNDFSVNKVIETVNMLGHKCEVLE